MQTIPDDVIKQSKALDKNLKKSTSGLPWYRVPWEKLPATAMTAISTGGGSLKKGVKLWIVAGNGRTVFIGPDSIKSEIPEYVGLTEYGSQCLIQMPRDAVMSS